MFSKGFIAYRTMLAFKYVFKRIQKVFWGTFVLEKIKMRLIKVVILIFFVHAHFLIFVVNSEGQNIIKKYIQSDVRAGDIPREPGWKDPAYRGWEVLSIPGLISTYYDLDLDGKLDYMVTRKISRKASSEEIDMDRAIELAQYDQQAVYFSNPVIYFASKYPLFYCKGLDYRKNCRNIWVDISEDGLNGNEEIYTLSSPLQDAH